MLHLLWKLLVASNDLLLRSFRAIYSLHMVPTCVFSETLKTAPVLQSSIAYHPIL